MTGKIKKIISIENGDSFVADIEGIENRITQNSSNLETAKQELSNKCNEALSEAKAYTDTEKAKYIPLTGGLVKNSYIDSADNSGLFRLEKENGSMLFLFDVDSTAYMGGAILRTVDKDAHFKDLQIKNNGSFTWDNKKVEIVELEGNNYIKYSSGLTFMWGLFGVDAGIKRKTVNLPIPFNSNYNVFLTNQGNNNAYGSNLGYQVVIKSLSTFDIQHTWDGATGWYYLAIGY